MTLTTHHTPKSCLTEQLPGIICVIHVLGIPENCQSLTRAVMFVKSNYDRPLEKQVAIKPNNVMNPLTRYNLSTTGNPDKFRSFIRR